jgi:hypothetical protein
MLRLEIIRSLTLTHVDTEGFRIQGHYSAEVIFHIRGSK